MPKQKTPTEIARMRRTFEHNQMIMRKNEKLLERYKQKIQKQSNRIYEQEKWGRWVVIELSVRLDEWTKRNQYLPMVIGSFDTRELAMKYKTEREEAPRTGNVNDRYYFVNIINAPQFTGPCG